MSDLRERFRDLDGIEFGETWTEVLTRIPHPPAPERPTRRIVAAAVAFAVAVAGIGLAVRAFNSGPTTPAVTPVPIVPKTNGKIAYLAGQGQVGTMFGIARVYVADPDGANARSITGKGNIAEVVWSPDGSRIGYVDTHGEFGDGQIFVMNADGSDRHAVVGDGRETLAPGGLTWSPDGTWIAYHRTVGQEPNGKWAYRIFAQPVDGGGAVQLTDGPGTDVEPTWSPDGTQIAFQRANLGTDRYTWGIYVMNADGSGIKPLAESSGPSTETATENTSPSWSPDGRWILFARGYPDDSSALMLIHPDGTDQHAIYRCDAPCGVLGRPSWSPDGTTIAVTLFDGTGPANSILMDADGSNVRPVHLPQEAVCCLSWQPVQEAAPSPIVTPTSTGRSLVRGACVRSHALGDFDGDGVEDGIDLYDVRQADVPCSAKPDVERHMRVSVSFGSGSGFRQPYRYCLYGLCGIRGTPDIDGDGRSELVADAGAGAAYASAEFFRVDANGIRPLRIAAPGDPKGSIEPGPAIIGGGHDFVTQSAAACVVGSDGSRSLVSWQARRDDGHSPWRVHRTTMVLRGDTLVVVSTDDHTMMDVHLPIAPWRLCA